MSEFSQWHGLDITVEEKFESSPVRVTMPVYGQKPGGFSRILVGEWVQNVAAWHIENVEKQFTSKLTSLRPTKTLDELVRQLFSLTTIGTGGEHKLTRVGQGVYEFRLGEKRYADQTLVKRLLQLPLGTSVEIGYVSPRTDFAGNVSREAHAYVGHVHGYKGESIVLRLGSGEYRNFTIERIAWLETVRPDFLYKGPLHHEAIELEFSRNVGFRNRLHMRTRIAKRGDFAFPLKQVERHKGRSNSDTKRVEFEKLQGALSESYEHMKLMVEKYQVQESIEMNELLKYMKRLLTVNGVS